MFFWIGFVWASHALWLESGRVLRCDHYEPAANQVLIWQGEHYFSLPSAAIDWQKTRAAAARKDGEPEAGAGRAVQSPPVAAPFRRGNEAMPAAFIIDKLDVKDADLHDLLRFLSDRVGFHLVIDGSVPHSKGTYFFKNIAWDQALEVILRTAGLDYQILYGALLVGPLKY